MAKNKQNLFLELESKMVDKVKLNFKIDEDYIAEFLVDTKFLNTKCDEFLAEFMIYSNYAKENDIYLDVQTLTYTLLVKYFVTQEVKNGKFEPVIKTSNTVEESFNTLISTSKAMTNIINTDGENFFEIIISMFLANIKEVEKLTNRMKGTIEMLDKHKDRVIEMMGNQLNTEE